MKEEIRSWLLHAGAVAVGCAEATPPEGAATRRFRAWLEAGRHGALAYMERHGALRRDPALLLEGARTVVSVAWPYLPPRLRDASLPFIARYAYCADYHKAIRRVARPLLRSLEEKGVRARLCVDSAPVHERYWAVRAGVGFTGRNGCLIVPGHGSWVFLSEILLDVALEADAPCREHCAGCGACLRACPTGALGTDGTVDCRRCLSALTVEMPGGTASLPPGAGSLRTLAGCDRCQEVCPHNRDVPAGNVPELATLPHVFGLTAGELEGMDDEGFRARYAGTALYRPGLAGLLANLRECHGHQCQVSARGHGDEGHEHLLE